MTPRRPAAPAITPELRLLMACCRWPPSPQREVEVAAAAENISDWTVFMAAARSHRVLGLAGDGLGRARIALRPGDAAALKAAMKEVAVSGLSAAMESVRLQSLFQAAGIKAQVLKGAALAMLAYGTPTLKQSWDIDLLVAHDDLLGAQAALERAGYSRIDPHPGVTDRRLLLWSEFAHEAVFRHGASGYCVELHWRLSTRPRFEPDVSRGQEVPIAPGKTVWTLPDEDLFTYLCLHGGVHGWARLKWLADLAAWLSPKSPRAIEDLYQASAAQGYARFADLALELCSRYLGLPLPPVGAPGSTLRILEKASVNNMEKVIRRPGEAARAGPFLRMTLRRNGRTRPSEFVHWLVSPTDVLLFGFPRKLLFLYPMIRAPSFALRRFGKIVSGRA